MRFRFYHFCCSILLIINLNAPSFGQIVNINADTVVNTSKISGDTSIFVFQTQVKDSLKAHCPDTGIPTFHWNQYDTVNNTFNLPMPSGIADDDSIVSGLPSGGYQVHITSSSGYDHSFVAWVYMDSLSVTIEHDANRNLIYIRYFCENTDIPATATHSKYIYYTPQGMKQVLADPKFIWSTSVNPDTITSLADSAAWLRVKKPKLPLEKTTFYAQVQDKYGLISKKDSVYYTPIICKAIIGGPTFDSLYVRADKHSAPFHVAFGNLSKNAVKFKWYYAAPDTSHGKEMTILTLDSVRYIYTETGTFNAKLVAASKEGCVDTASTQIVVDPGTIGQRGTTKATTSWPDMPTYFCPGSKYPNFKIYNLSIKHFKFTVFSKWGKPVYEFEGNDMLNGWQGWDGRINGNGPMASAGIYYYVLEVMSYDKTVNNTDMNPTGQYKGFFYIFREN